MPKALTDKTVEALKPTDRRYDIWDAKCPGLGVRVSPSGAKIFCVKYRYGPTQRRITLGTYPRITLASARSKALDTLRQVDEGIDPAGRRRQQGLLVDAVVQDFIRQYAKPRNRSWKGTESILTRELVSRFGQSDVRTLTRAHILEIMDDAVDRDAGYQANRFLAAARKLFNWCVERGVLETNPASGIKAPIKEIARDRVLAPAELARVITAATATPFPFGPYVLMLLATAQRRSEVLKMRWDEIDFEKATWEIPAEKAKNGRANIVPLSSFALSALATVPRLLGTDLVFTTTGRTPISGITKMHARIVTDSKTSGWRLHDLRRTAASGMAQDGIAPHVIEKVLNHSNGIISGVAAIYNRYGYAAEKREALEKWSTYLEGLAATSELQQTHICDNVGSVIL